MRLLLTFLHTLFTGVPAFAADPVPRSPNGIEFPAGYRDWRVLSMAQRLDNRTLRVILGKDENLARECIACHTPVKNDNCVFRIPAPFCAASR